MPFAIKSFTNIGGANLGSRFLVERGSATELAFIDGNFGDQGAETVLINFGSLADYEYDVSGTVPGGAAYPVSVGVSSKGAGQFSIWDGAAWQGPYAVAADVPYAMLVRLPTETLRVKFRAIHASNLIRVEARTVPSPRAMAAI